MKERSCRIAKIKRFINRYNRERVNSPSEKHDWRKFEKNNVTNALNVFYTKKTKYIPLMFQTITQIVKNKLLF